MRLLVRVTMYLVQMKHQIDLEQICGIVYKYTLIILINLCHISRSTLITLLSGYAPGSVALGWAVKSISYKFGSENSTLHSSAGVRVCMLIINLQPCTYASIPWLVENDSASDQGHLRCKTYWTPAILRKKYGCVSVWGMTCKRKAHDWMKAKPLAVVIQTSVPPMTARRDTRKC